MDRRQEPVGLRFACMADPRKRIVELGASLGPPGVQKAISTTCLGGFRKTFERTPLNITARTENGRAEVLVAADFNLTP